MYRFVKAGPLALALVALSNAGASAGSITPSDPFSPYSIAEVESARIRLYEHEMRLRAIDPTGFDLKHAVLGTVLASEKGYDAFLSDHTFNKLFCEHTPFVWRVIAGDIFYHRIHPFETSPPGRGTGGGPPLVDPGSSGGSPFSGGGSPPGGSNPDGPGGPGGSVGIASVPEPSSWVLMTAGLVLATLAYGRRRVCRLATFWK